MRVKCEVDGCNRTPQEVESWSKGRLEVLFYLVRRKPPTLKHHRVARRIRGEERRRVCQPHQVDFEASRYFETVTVKRIYELERTEGEV